MNKQKLPLEGNIKMCSYPSLSFLQAFLKKMENILCSELIDEGPVGVWVEGGRGGGRGKPREGAIPHIILVI